VFRPPTGFDRTAALLVLIVLGSVHLSAQQAPAVARYRAGTAALARGDEFTAVEEFSTAVMENPAYFEAHMGLAEAYYRLDEYDQAIASAERAANLRRDDIALLNLQGRIQIGLGNTAAAARLFERVLERERFNVDALIGRAELSVAQGRTDEAARRYDDAIRLAPTERRALLALAILYDHLGDQDRAEQYIRLAVRHHPENAVVHLLAAEHYLQSQRLHEAERHVRTALSIDPRSTDSLFIAAHLALIRADYPTVLSNVEQMISIDTQDARAWYLRGVALAELSELDDSLRSFQRALTVRPDEEIPRMAAEQELLERTDTEDERRIEFARHHFVRARGFADRNLFSRAMASYRRGLQLHPFDAAGRLAYADLYRLRGYRARYLEELRVIESLGLADRNVRERIESFEAALADSVASIWNVEQFGLPRERTRFGLFYTERPATSDYPQSDRFLALEMRNEMMKWEMVESRDEPVRFESLANAYRSARRENWDYFVVFEFSQADRSFFVDATLYVSRTGTEIARYRANRTGNDRIHRALSAVAADIAGTIPLRGSIIQRNADRVLVNLGSLHGIAADDTLEIVRKGALLLRSDVAGYTYAASDVLGSLRVTRVDDLVSEGIVTSRTVFDYINLGDDVLQTSESGSRSTENAFFPPIYRRIRSIR
jgi:tetratricopeptide (TPR) repeat protein